MLQGRMPWLRLGEQGDAVPGLGEREDAGDEQGDAGGEWEDAGSEDPQQQWQHAAWQRLSHCLSMPPAGRSTEGCREQPMPLDVAQGGWWHPN